MPKFHYGQHTSICVEFGNPRFYWCYMDEDFMKLVKAIAERSLAGSSPTIVAGKIVQKSILGKTAAMHFGVSP